MAGTSSFEQAVRPFKALRIVTVAEVVNAHTRTGIAGMNKAATAHINTHM